MRTAAQAEQNAAITKDEGSDTDCRTLLHTARW
jgi:hypothetical protein